MQSFKTNDLRYKNKPMPNKKRFGVMAIDAATQNHKTFTGEREAARAKSIPNDYSVGTPTVSKLAFSDGASNGGSSSKLLDK